MNASPQELAKEFAQLLGVPVPDLTAPAAPVAPPPKPAAATAATATTATGAGNVTSADKNAGATAGKNACATPAAAAPANPVRMVDYAAKGFHLDVSVPADKIVAAAQILDRTGYSIDTITGVDWMAEGTMEVVYDFFSLGRGQAVPDSKIAPWRVVLRARIPRENPEIPTIQKVFPGANWHERETHDFFGIKFLGHPDLSPLLLPEDATYHPLRKDFAL